MSNHTKNFERLFDEKVDLLIVVGGGSLDSRYYDKNMMMNYSLTEMRWKRN